MKCLSYTKKQDGQPFIKRVLMFTLKKVIYDTFAQRTKKRIGKSPVKAVKKGRQMNYHFKLHKENIGYWAECCELDGCVTEGDTLDEIYQACKEALDVYLYEPDDSKRMVSLPDKALDNKKGIIMVCSDAVPSTTRQA
jgi:predicted RNase H-like HicB family nuclease